MSFRNRLTVFFIVLVILPMIVVATVGFVLASDSEQGKTDARLPRPSAPRPACSASSRTRRRRPRGMIGQDQQLAAAIQAGSAARSRTGSSELASGNGIRRGVMTLEGPGASRPAAATRWRPRAPA